MIMSDKKIFNILVVDDNINNLNLLANILSPRNYKVRRAINGALALRAIQSSPPHLILLDINLPDISGYEICAQLKNNSKTCDIPIIFVSASNETLDKVRAFSEGGVDYISKPFDVAEVLARVENHIAFQDAKNEIQALNQALEHRVFERTSQLELVNHQLKISNQALQQQIAERQQAEEQLHLFDSVVVNSNDAVLITTAEPIEEEYSGPRIIYVNHAFTIMTGYILDEVFGKSPRILKGIKTDPVVCTKIRKALKAWQPIQIEILNYRKDGTEFWADLNIFPVINEGGLYTHWVGVQRDVTRRKQQEQEMQSALEKEKELNELKSHFVSTASHEFRTPLATILSSVELLEYYGHLSTESENREYFQQIRTAIDRMTSLMSDVLTLEKTDVGKMEINPIQLNLEQFCHSLITEIHLGSKRQHNISFLLRGESSQGLLDEKVLRHVFGNLLSNAVKYSPIEGNISFEVIRHNHEVIFQIRDQGIGIPEEARQRLFEPFFRAKNVGTVSGTGLGLSIVKRLVEMHGGHINVDSQEGKGTTFTVVLPQKEPFGISHYDLPKSV
jgi:PAS domain S-box-containing protein